MEGDDNEEDTNDNEKSDHSVILDENVYNFILKNCINKRVYNFILKNCIDRGFTTLFSKVRLFWERFSTLVIVMLY